jgi:hypothetical protein
MPIHIQLCLAGFSIEFRVTAVYPRFTDLMVIRFDGGYAVTFAPVNRNLTCTETKLSKTDVVFAANPSVIIN